MKNEKIFTIDARNNILLEFIHDYFNLDDRDQHAQINSLFHELLNVLSSKGINYYDLSNALIPNPDRNEAVFVFDTTTIESFWYGRDISELVARNGIINQVQTEPIHINLHNSPLTVVRG